MTYNPSWGTGGGVSDGNKGDVSVAGGGTVWTVNDGVVTLAKIATISALSILGNTSASPATAAALSASQVKTLLAIAAADVSGLGTLATQSGTFSGTSSGTNTGDQNTFGTIAVSGQSNVVADAPNDTLTLAAGTGITITTDAGTDTVTVSSNVAGLTDGDKGDITVSGGGAAWAIDTNAVTFGKMQQVGTDVLLGRDAAGTGNIETLAVSGGLEFSGSGGIRRSALTGDVTAAAGSNSTAIALQAVTYGKIQNTVGDNAIICRPGTAGSITEVTLGNSQLMGRGSTGDLAQISLGSGLLMSGTTLSATDSGGGNASMLFGAITTTSTSSNTNWTPITGSEVTVEAGKTYAIRWRLRTYSAANTTGLRLRRAFSVGVTGTVFGWHALVMSNATAMTGRSSRESTADTTTGASLGNATSTTTDAGTHWVDCLFQCTGGGTISLEMQSEVNTSAATVDGDGSYWEATVRES